MTGNVEGPVGSRSRATTVAAILEPGSYRRKQREFEQKVAKEAKIWADNLGGRKFAPESSFKEMRTKTRAGPSSRPAVSEAVLSAGG